MDPIYMIVFSVCVLAIAQICYTKAYADSLHRFKFIEKKMEFFNKMLKNYNTLLKNRNSKIKFANSQLQVHNSKLAKENEEIAEFLKGEDLHNKQVQDIIQNILVRLVKAERVQE